jgi:hypothetical protein
MWDELELILLKVKATLASAEVSGGAVAKADQKSFIELFKC